jgi:hypothetical protein
MKKQVNGIIVDMTADEISARQLEEEKALKEITTAEEEATAKENLKASAKAKLIAGQPLTEEEANTIVL